MPPTALDADSGSSCQLCLVTHTDKHVGDQRRYRQSFQVIFTKLAPPEPMVMHWELELCYCGEGKSMQGYGQLQHCPMLGLLSVSHGPFGAERRKRKGEKKVFTSHRQHLPLSTSGLICYKSDFQLHV